MRPQNLKNSKQEIADGVARISGEVREVIIFVEEPSDAEIHTLETDILAEMEPFTAQVGCADYSSEAIYTRE